LDTGLLDACEEDLASVCSTSVEKMEKSGEEKDRAMACLQQFKEELHSDACRCVRWLVDCVDEI
jgi:hypothetical protein